MPSESNYIDIVFDGPPSHISGRFVEVENPERHSIRVGDWVHRDDDYWVLRIKLPLTGDPDGPFAADGTEGDGPRVAATQVVPSGLGRTVRDLFERFGPDTVATYVSSKRALIDEELAAAEAADIPQVDTQRGVFGEPESSDPTKDELMARLVNAIHDAGFDVQTMDTFRESQDDVTREEDDVLHAAWEEHISGVDQVRLSPSTVASSNDPEVGLWDAPYVRPYEAGYDAANDPEAEGVTDHIPLPIDSEAVARERSRLLTETADRLIGRAKVAGTAFHPPFEVSNDAITTDLPVPDYSRFEQAVIDTGKPKACEGCGTPAGHEHGQFCPFLGDPSAAPWDFDQMESIGIVNPDPITEISDEAADRLLEAIRRAPIEACDYVRCDDLAKYIVNLWKGDGDSGGILDTEFFSCGGHVAWFVSQYAATGLRVEFECLAEPDEEDDVEGQPCFECHAESTFYVDGYGNSTGAREYTCDDHQTLAVNNLLSMNGYEFVETRKV